MKKNKVVSPCFFVHYDTEYKLQRMQRKLGFSKSVLVEIAIGLLDEKELQEAVVSRSGGNGSSCGTEETSKEQTLF